MSDIGAVIITLLGIGLILLGAFLIINHLTIKRRQKMWDDAMQEIKDKYERGE